MHCKKFKKVLTWLTQKNPVLLSVMYHKLKYLLFEYPTNYKEISYAWSYIRLPPWHTPPWPRSYLCGGLSAYLPMDNQRNQTHASLKSCASTRQLYYYPIFFHPQYHNSKFLSSHSLTFNPTCNIPNSYVSSMYHVKGLSQNIPWHISHTFRSRSFSPRGLSAHIWQIYLFAVTPHFTIIQT